MNTLLSRANVLIDTSCSAAVSAVVVGVNLYYFDPAANTIVVPAATTACCLTAALSKSLKRLINQSRPLGAAKLSPGMPSNHATALSFLSVAACTGLYQRWARQGGNTAAAAVAAMPVSLVASMSAVMGYGLWATACRVLCGHHTVPQVLVGYAFGFSCAAACVGMNYGGYDAAEGVAGGRVDGELSRGAKQVALVLCCVSATMALAAILRGSPLMRKFVKGKYREDH